jgi:hypothetical protein
MYYILFNINKNKIYKLSDNNLKKYNNYNLFYNYIHNNVWNNKIRY